MRIPVKEKKRSPPELTRVDNTVMGCQPGTKAMNTRSALWGKEEIDQASRKLQHSFHQDILLYIKKKKPTTYAYFNLWLFETIFVSTFQKNDLLKGNKVAQYI